MGSDIWRSLPTTFRCLYVALSDEISRGRNFWANSTGASAVETILMATCRGGWERLWADHSPGAGSDGAGPRSCARC